MIMSLILECRPRVWSGPFYGVGCFMLAAPFGRTCGETMKEKKYKVVFTGELSEGLDPEDVKKRISSRFKMTPEKTEKLFRGSPVVVKKNLDLERAHTYKRAFKKEGAICRISGDGLSSAVFKKKQEYNASKSAVGRMTCPSCGHEQERAPDCVKCGIIISKYKEKSERTEEVPPFAEEERVPVRARTIPVRPAVIFSVLLVFFVAYVGFSWWSGRPIVHGPGAVAPDEPLQEATEREAFSFKDYRIYPLAEYHIRARVLGKEKYNFGREAELSPYDLALGWGRMSDEDVLVSIKIKQSGRFYYWSTKRFPIPKKEIEMSSANTHIIPADEFIEKELKKVRQGHIVEIRGYLVRVQAKDGWRWISSLSRKDTGNGACEVLYAEELEMCDRL